MNHCCLICNTRAGVSLRNAISFFGEHNTVPSGRKLSEILSEILDQPLEEDTVHSQILCKKCQKTCTEYDTIGMRMLSIKSELSEQYKTSSQTHKPAATDSPVKIIGEASERKFIGKKLVLPASKLQPIPADFQLNIGKLASMCQTNFKVPGKGKITVAPSLLNLKVTVGSSVLMHNLKTTTANKTEKQTDSTVFTTFSNSIIDDLDKIIMTSNKDDSGQYKNPIMSFNVNSLPKDFFSSAILSKITDNDGNDKSENGNDEDGNENNEEHVMEIDEDSSLSVVPVSSSEADGVVVHLSGSRSEIKKPTSDDSEFMDVNVLPALEDGNEGTDQKYSILGKLQILSDDDDDGSDPHTIVVDGGNGSILQMVSGQKFLYDGNEISLVMPEVNDDGDGDDNNGDSQDSNDESQIELQVSGDEETANAIIAAAQEQGGAFIKVESGEMFRVKSVHSKSPAGHEGGDEAGGEGGGAGAQIVSREGEGFKCLLCENNDPHEDPCVGDADATMRHVKTVHDARIYICQFCGVVIRKRSQYTAHMAQHSVRLKLTSSIKSKLHECTVCRRSYNSSTLLAEHMNTHTGSRPYSCRLCDKAFASKYTHQAHLKTHQVRPRPFKCAQCGKSFLTQQNLNQHEKTHSGVKDFICQVCNKAFGTQHNLEVHGVVHSGSKPFVCGVCGKAFARRAEVRDHMRIHTGERPFKCDVCGATFSQRSNLHTHKRATHLDDKRYHCDQCPKRFKRRRLLEYHIKASHTGERPLKCEVCRATFVYPEHYKKHMRIHSGERPYVCEICGKSFNSRDNRNTHRFVHSDKKIYECLTCGAGYMRKQLLYAHMNSSGHMAESIVVNQPRVTKVTVNGVTTKVVDVHSSQTKPNKSLDNVMIETEELDMESAPSRTDIKVEEEQSTNIKYFLQDGTSQDGGDSFMLSDIDSKTQGAIIEAIASDAGNQTQIVANDENGGIVRLIQIKLPDGNNGWVAVNETNDNS